MQEIATGNSRKTSKQYHVSEMRKMIGPFEKIESLDSRLQGLPSGPENQVRVMFFVCLG